MSYCDELRRNQREFVETRSRLLIALAFVTIVGVALLIAGRVTMAAYVGILPGLILAVLAAGNGWMIRRTARRIATDCPDQPPPAG